MSAQDDLNSAANNAGNDASAAESVQNAIASTSQTAAEVKASFSYYVQFAPKKPSKWTLESAASWSAGALKNYAAANAKDWGGAVIQNVASAYGLDGYVPDQIPTNEKEAAKALVHVGAAAFQAETGIDPSIAEVTVDAVMDGKLDKHDCEAIGATAGAVAGAALCQTFGIPAPIGAFLGGKIGGFIGGEVADIFGIGKQSYDDWLKQQKARAAQELSDYETYCAQVRSGYWQVFDATVIAAERRWEELEVRLGTKFDVRFFGRAPVAISNYIDQHTYPFPSFLSPSTCTISCPDGFQVRSGGAPTLAKLSAADAYALQQQCRLEMGNNRALPAFERLTWLAHIKNGDTVTPPLAEACTHDCLADFGCPYPDMLGAITAYPTSPSLLGNTARVCSAFRALGFVWLPAFTPAMLRSWGFKRTGNTAADWATLNQLLLAHQYDIRRDWCDLPPATLDEIKHENKHQQWLDFLRSMVNSEQRRIQAFNGAAVRLTGDLAKTAAMVAVQTQLTAARAKQSVQGLGALESFDASSWVNNGALVAGLGYLAWKTRR